MENIPSMENKKDCYTFHTTKVLQYGNMTHNLRIGSMCQAKIFSLQYTATNSRFISIYYKYYVKVKLQPVMVLDLLTKT